MPLIGCMRNLRGAACAMPLALAALWAGAQEPAGVVRGGIYTCTDDRGRKITSDRPIPDCNAKEQRVLNKDGSLKAVHPATLTADERAEKDVRDRKAAEARAAQADAVRRDRNLVHRYPTEVAHNKARGSALDSVRAAIRLSELRLAELARERKPLEDEAEFYKGRQLPPKLKAQIEGVDTAVEAQRSATQTQAAELSRINQLYDAELERLKRLWAGAAAGSLGPLAVPNGAAKAASAAR